MSTEAPRSRRSHDRADRQARNRLIGLSAVAALTLVGALALFWWYRALDPVRDGAPGWFPDGLALVFAGEVGTGRADIYRMDRDGGGRSQLISDPANDSAPAVSPDGRRIAFETDRDGNYEIYVMDVAGTNPVRLTNDPARDQAPAWSPDGRRLVFTSDRDSRASADVYVMNADGTGVERLSNDQAHWAPQFSPDGTKLAVQVNLDVQIFGLGDGSRQRLTFAPQNGMNPTWSPDSRRLAFVTTRNGRAEIFTMNADGSDAKVLVTMATGAVIDPRWSPDGNLVAFVMVPEVDAAAAPAAADEPRPEDAPAIYTVEVSSGVVTRLSR